MASSQKYYGDACQLRRNRLWAITASAGCYSLDCLTISAKYILHVTYIVHGASPLTKNSMYRISTLHLKLTPRYICQFFQVTLLLPLRLNIPFTETHSSLHRRDSQHGRPRSLLLWYISSPQSCLSIPSVTPQPCGNPYPPSTTPHHFSLKI